MKSARTRVDVHPHACDCLSCTPYVPADGGIVEAAGQALRDLAIGAATLLAGLAVTTAYDWATAGPGLGVMFGWAS